MSVGKVPIRPPGIHNTDDKFQRAVRDAIKKLDDPALRRTYVKGVTLTSGVTTKVAHRLGKIPSGWHVSDPTADARIWRDPTIPMTNDIIPLTASAAVTVDLIFW